MKTRAFTLLEVLIAIALAGMVLLAMNTFIFSMGELWGRNSDSHLFNEHVNAVTRFVQGEMNQAVFPPAARASATPVSAPQITPQNGSVDNYITFDLLAGSRVFSWPDRALPEVTCSLQMRRGEGLFLLWHSRLETRFSEDPPRETLLTPLVTELDYDYYDSNTKRWTTDTALQNDPTSGQPTPPQRLRLTFTYGKLTRVTLVSLPLAQQGMPNF